MWYRFKKIKKNIIIISTMWYGFLLHTGECRQEEFIKKINLKIKINWYIQCYGNKENKEKN